MIARSLLGPLAAAAALVLAGPAARAQSGKPAPAAQAPASGIVGGKPAGLFFMTRYWSFTRTLEKVVWYFAPDGKVYQNLTTGFSPADLAAHKGPKGTYQVTGGNLEVTWADGKTTKSRFEPDATGFGWDAGIFTPVQRIKSAQSVAGKYEGGESVGGSGNSVAISKTLTLNPDGTFTWEGVSFVESTTRESRISGGGESATRGTWKSDAYSLTLTDSTGKVLRGIAFPFDDEKTPAYPDHLFFAGIMYKRL